VHVDIIQQHDGQMDSHNYTNTETVTTHTELTRIKAIARVVSVS